MLERARERDTETARERESETARQRESERARDTDSDTESEREREVWHVFVGPTGEPEGRLLQVAGACGRSLGGGGSLETRRLPGYRLAGACGKRGGEELRGARGEGPKKQ